MIKDERVKIPRILNFISRCDFTKPDIIDWAWDRLYTALLAPVGEVTYFKRGDEYDPYKDDYTDESPQAIEFPVHGPRLDYDSNVGQTNDVNLSSGPRTRDDNLDSTTRVKTHANTSRNGIQKTSERQDILGNGKEPCEHSYREAVTGFPSGSSNVSGLHPKQQCNGKQ